MLTTRAGTTMRMRATFRRLAVISLLGLFVAACGSDASNVTSGDSVGSEPPPQQADALGDPRELVSLMNPGSAQTVVTFESYEQLRDYSDLAAIGTISNVRIERTYGAPFVEPGVMAFDFRAQRLLG